MKSIRVMVMVLMAIIVLGACRQQRDEEIYYKAQKKLGNMVSYTCTAMIHVEDKGGERVYKFRQFFKYPDKYRLESIETDKELSNIIIYNGKAAWLINPSLNQKWKTNSFNGSLEQMMFIGEFMKGLLTNKGGTIDRENIDGQQYIVIHTPISGGNLNFNSKKLWISANKLEPTKLYIFDNINNIRFRVYYTDFQYNPKLEDELFYIELENQP